MRIRKKKRKDSKNKIHGEELLGPQASLRVTPCPPAPNHTRGEVIRPPSQIKNNSYSVIRTRDLDDLSSTRCAPTTTARPSGNYTKLKDFYSGKKAIVLLRDKIRFGTIQDPFRWRTSPCDELQIRYPLFPVDFPENFLYLSFFPWREKCPGIFLPFWNFSLLSFCLKRVF